MKAHIIFYVSNQKNSKLFYKKLLQISPCLDVAGMTEFQLNPDTKLGLMPEAGIVKILQNKVPDPASGNGIPRCELYLFVEDVDVIYKRALDLGATAISEPAGRDWGDRVGYVADVDGHVIAFAG